ncbi:MAG: hypothetical protein WA721_16615 [Candidatus Binataceae bacterium]
MDEKTLAALTENGWVIKRGFPGVYVRGEELVKREKLNWVADVSEQVQQIEQDAAKLKVA